MAQNTVHKPLVDSKTGCRDYDAATTLNGAGGASGVYAHDTTTYLAWVDFGAGALFGDGTRQQPASRAAVKLRVTDFETGASSGVMTVKVALSSDGSATAATYILRSYDDDDPITAWEEVIPFSTVHQGVAYRYAQIQVEFDQNDCAAKAGWHVTELPFHG